MATKVKKTKKQRVKKQVVNVSATKRAFEKIQEIFNGSRKKFFQFINNITFEEVKGKKFQVFLSNGNKIFYYKQCKNAYVIFTIDSETRITIVDILTETDFLDMLK